jgi:hypothetical protein
LPSPLRTGSFKAQASEQVPPLNIVLEAGHANFGDAERIFQEEKRMWVHAGVPILRTLTKADKDDCRQLMMADFAAHSEYIMEKREIDTGISRNRPTVAVPRGMTGSTHYLFTPETLRKLRAEIVTMRWGMPSPPRDRRSARHEHPQHHLAALARLAEAREPLLGAGEQLGRVR